MKKLLRVAKSMKNKGKRYFIHALPGPKQWEFLEAIYRFLSVHKKECFTNADMMMFCGLDRFTAENYVKMLEKKRILLRKKRSMATFWCITDYGHFMYRHLKIIKNKQLELFGAD